MCQPAAETSAESVPMGREASWAVSQEDHCWGVGHRVRGERQARNEHTRAPAVGAPSIEGLLCGQNMLADTPVVIS